MTTAVGREVFAFAGFSLDPRQRLLYGPDGEPIPLSGRAFDTLLYLVQHPNELIDKQTLMKAVWPNVVVEENNLNQNISAVRRALGEVPGEHRFVVTVPGRGFRFVSEVGLTDTQSKDPPASTPGVNDLHLLGDGVLPGTTAPRHAAPWIIAAILAAAVAVVAWVHFSNGAPTTRATAEVLRYQVFPPENTRFDEDSGRSVTLLLPGSAISPDGRRLVFIAKAQEGPSQLWVRDLDSLTSRALPGTEGASSPFWSPDSHVVAFGAAGRLERVDISGGPPQVICVAAVLGGAWSENGIILFGGYEGLGRVPAAGGTPTLQTKRDASQGDIAHVTPSFLPGGRRFIYQVWGGRAFGTYVGSLDASGEDRAPKPLIAGTRAVSVPRSAAAPDSILFLQDRTLRVQGLDVARGVLEGDSTPIASGVINFSVSANGILAYTTGAPGTGQLKWFDRQGNVLGTLLGTPPMFQPTPALSPDDGTVAVGGNDLWRCNIAHDSCVRLTFDGKNNSAPVWSPDGSHIAFASYREGPPTVYQVAANGIGQPQALESPAQGAAIPSAWSRDGRYLIEQRISGTRGSVWVLPLAPSQPGGQRKAVPFLTEGFNAYSAALAPDARWLAYVSDQTGRFEVFVQTFLRPGGKWQVSPNGGSNPKWSRDGKELYYLGLDGKLMAVDVRSGSDGDFEPGTPQALFDPHIVAGIGSFDVSTDGRFLIPAVVGQSTGPINIVVNWQAARAP